MPTAPLAPKRPTEITQHGQTRIDHYFWLRYREDPAVIEYLKAEMNYLEEVTAHTKNLQTKLFEEMKARIKEEDITAPEKHGAYFYYARTEQSSQYPIYCRKRGSMDAPEEVILDQNQLAEGKTFCRLGAFAVSPDDSKLAYSIDPDGSERGDLFIKDLATGSLYPEIIHAVFGDVYENNGLAWGNDNATLFYAALDPANRPYKLFRHILGTDPSTDEMLYHEEDESFFLTAHKSRSDQFVLIQLRSMMTREYLYLDADQPNGKFQSFGRERGIEYTVEHHGDQFLIVTNEGALNNKLMSAPIGSPSKENWREILPHRADVLIESIQPFADHLVAHERKGGLKQIRISKPDGVSAVRYVEFPEAVYDYQLTSPEYETNQIRINYWSLITPKSAIDVDMDSAEWKLIKRDEVPGGYDRSQYVMERIEATSPDGKRVPISLVYKKDLKRDGSNPCLLHSYGSYGATTDAEFNARVFSLIDRGFVYALAHIRGGADLGRAWYEDGRLLHKKNSFIDFIACGEELIAQGYTAKNKLSISGISAGGLLVAASMIMRPDLFKAVVAKVPFVDVINSMNDPSIPLTVTEWEQWGNPAKQDEFEYMISYSPYDNVQALAYPHLLITAGLNDPRVAYWEPAKFCAKLREMKQGDNTLLLKTNFEAGHAGSSGRFDFLKEIAFEYAFLIDKLA
jgi:oligopeptidase B